MAKASPRLARRLAVALGVAPPPSQPYNPAQHPSDDKLDPEQLAFLELPEDASVSVVVSAEECERAVQRLVSDLATEQGSGASVVGLDTEWADPKPTSVLLQLASRRHCVLVRLERLGAQGIRECSTLLHLLADPRVALAGVGILRDAALLASEWGIRCESLVELSSLAEAVGVVSSRHGVGLASLCRQVLGHDLRKPKALRCGDWRAEPLSEPQVQYAALDAVAGRQAMLALLQGRGKGATAGAVEQCRDAGAELHSVP